MSFYRKNIIGRCFDHVLILFVYVWGICCVVQNPPVGGHARPNSRRPLTIATLEPDYDEELQRFVPVEELTSYLLQETQLEKMPCLFKQALATLQVAAANDAGQSSWATDAVPSYRHAPLDRHVWIRPKVQPYCEDAAYGSTVQATCPATCGLCRVASPSSSQAAKVLMDRSFQGSQVVLRCSLIAKMRLCSTVQATWSLKGAALQVAQPAASPGAKATPRC
ncbi:unnamed protein product [Prorocentrum cordatum]|uniref:ShKT domain-containing protein n=1 Tax=Prorocentrum cordatum TaxID=2364126 RepID=A0ABN9UY29_9DINO|nr:unnamed protein product [Polarella glacialis]